MGKLQLTYWTIPLFQKNPRSFKNFKKNHANYQCLNDPLPLVFRQPLLVEGSILRKYPRFFKKIHAYKKTRLSSLQLDPLSFLLTFIILDLLQIEIPSISDPLPLFLGNPPASTSPIQKKIYGFEIRSANCNFEQSDSNQKMVFLEIEWSWFEYSKFGSVGNWGKEVTSESEN